MDKIHILMRAKYLLQHIDETQDQEFLHIRALIDEYIETKCQHQIVYDLIDTSPDGSKSIRYCTHCEKTF